jgi:hypothetical protein
MDFQQNIELLKDSLQQIENTSLPELELRLNNKLNENNNNLICEMDTKLDLVEERIIKSIKEKINLLIRTELKNLNETVKTKLIK